MLQRIQSRATSPMVPRKISALTFMPDPPRHRLCAGRALCRKGQPFRTQAEVLRLGMSHGEINSQWGAATDCTAAVEPRYRPGSARFLVSERGFGDFSVERGQFAGQYRQLGVLGDHRRDMLGIGQDFLQKMQIVVAQALAFVDLFLERQQFWQALAFQALDQGGKDAGVILFIGHVVAPRKSRAGRLVSPR